MFQPGVSGNPKGRPPLENSLSTILRKKLDEIHPVELELAKRAGREPRDSKTAIAERLVAMALTGNLKAIMAIVDRMEGKAKATVTVDGQVDHTGTITHAHEPGGEAVLDTLIARLSALRKPSELEAPVDAEIVEQEPE